MTGTTNRLRGASRTDAGVHADGQIATVPIETQLSCADLCHGLNALLPTDIFVRQVSEASDAFEPRRDNVGKHYRYRFWTERELPLEARHRSHHLYRQLDLVQMAAAAQRCVGRHDFVAFRAADCDRENTQRTLYRCALTRQAGELCIDVEGTAFLKNMVRILAGTLVDVGSGRISLQEMTALLQGGDRKDAGATLPPQGLTLVRVFVKGDVR